MNTSFLPRLRRGALLGLALSLIASGTPAHATTSQVELIIQWHGAKHTVVLELDESAAPKTCANFKKLASLGFYDGIAFHRVIPGYIAQTGDPLTKDLKRRADWGTGGPGYVIPAEIKKPHVRGALATARLGDQSNPSRASSGSQFYIALTDIPSLNDSYTVFGKVASGMQAIDDMAMLATDQNNNPLDRIEIVSAKIISDSGAKLPDPASVSQPTPPVVASAPPPVEEKKEKAPAMSRPSDLPTISEPASAEPTVASNTPDPLPSEEKEKSGFLPFFKKKPESPDSSLPSISEPAAPLASAPPEPKPQPKPSAPPAQRSSSGLPALEENPLAETKPSASAADQPPASSSPLMGPASTAAEPPQATEPAEPPAKRGPLNRFLKRFW